MNITDIDILDVLHQKFYKKRIKIPEEYGIITACNPNHFGLFQLLYYSIYLSSTAIITVYDLELTPAQKKWCSQQEQLKVKYLNSDDLIFPKEKDTQYWPTWNKPLYFLNSPYQKNLWIDADCVVFGNLYDLLKKIDDRPVLFSCEFGCADKDISRLHRALQTHIIPHQSGPPCLNAGVLGFDTIRDRNIIDKWIESIQAAANDQQIQSVMPWYDQGGLQWTMEVLNKLDVICKDTSWNHDNIHLPNPDNIISFIKGLNPQECKLAHFAGTEKRRIQWDEVPINLNYLTLFYEWHPVHSSDGKIKALFRNKDEADDIEKM